MKIAIQGHPTRGKEVIQILESLGGINRCLFIGASDFWYFIDSNGYITNDHQSFLVDAGFKTYTLEEFEKEFPFKIGDIAISKTTNLIVTIVKLIENGFYFIRYNDGSMACTSAKNIKPLEMKRNITLTLDKTKEWYKKGGELKEIALQAYSEEELIKVDLPKTWEEFCENYPVKKGECFLNNDDTITVVPHDCTNNRIFKSWTPSKKSAEAHLAMIQLEQLRDCWRQGWIPTPGDSNYTIKFGFRGLDVYYFCTIEFLSFPTREMAEEFLTCFRDLIEKAGDLI